MALRLLIALVCVACGSKGDGGASGGDGIQVVGTSDDYMAFNDAMADKLEAILKGDPACDKLGASLSAMYDANKAMNDASRAWEAAHPGDKKRLAQRMESRLSTIKGAMTATFKRCKDNKPFTDAVAKMRAR